MLVDYRCRVISRSHAEQTLIAQLANRVAYEGYQLVTRTGLRLSAWHFENGRSQRTNMLFMTINAGLR